MVALSFIVASSLGSCFAGPCWWTLGGPWATAVSASVVVVAAGGGGVLGVGSIRGRAAADFGSKRSLRACRRMRCSRRAIRCCKLLAFVERVFGRGVAINSRTMFLRMVGSSGRWSISGKAARDHRQVGRVGWSGQAWPDYVHSSRRAQVQFAAFFEEYLLLGSSVLPPACVAGPMIAFSKRLAVLPVDAVEEHGQLGGNAG